jgi:hypothetical protein
LAGNLDEIRFVNFFGADFATTAGHQYPNFTCAVGDLKVQVCTSSVMKIQNRTVNTVGDADATEVDNVPLHGAHFMLKGNNVTRKSNWTQFFGAFEGDETVLFRTFPANGAIWDSNHDQPYIASPVDAVSINPNDLPKKSELSNCLSSETFVHNPGVIRSSYISQSYEMTVIAYLNLLLGTRGQVNNILAYNPRCGKTAAIWYDKVIGNVPQGNTTDVSIVLECQYRSGVYVFGKSKVKTLPLNFQFGAVEA